MYAVVTIKLLPYLKYPPQPIIRRDGYRMKETIKEDLTQLAQLQGQRARPKQ